MRRKLRVAVLASGGGSNLQALLDHCAGEAGRAWEVALVVSDRPDAGALARGERAGIPTEVVDRALADSGERERRLLEVLEGQGIEAVVLAGYLRLVPARVVRRYPNRIVNIHPALLPAFGGKGMYGVHVHRAVLDAGVRVSGVTVHLVDEVYDRGPIVAQWPVPVKLGDTPESLAARVLGTEHLIYPRTIDHLATFWSSGHDPEPVHEVGDSFREVGDSFRLSGEPTDHEPGDFGAPVNSSRTAPSRFTTKGNP